VRVVRRLLWLCLVAVVASVLAAVLWVHAAPVKPRHLTYSVANAVGGMAFDAACRRVERHWRCLIDDAEGSGNGSTYLVRMRGRRCWLASRTPGSFVNPKLKSRTSGCVGFWDRVSSVLL
jgi:hypothetical protein